MKSQFRPNPRNSSEPRDAKAATRWRLSIVRTMLMTRIRILCGIVAMMSIAASRALIAQNPSGTIQTDSPIAEVSNSKPWEYGALIQGGVGLEQRTDFSFFMVGGHLGKVLTPQIGSGSLRA